MASADAPKKSKSRAPEPLLDNSTGPWQETIEFNFPPFAVIYDHSGRVLVCGGGGGSKTGVPNKLIIVEAARASEIGRENEHAETSPSSSKNSKKSVGGGSSAVLMRKVCVFDTGSDAIMNMALHPSENLLACGVGDKCVIYNVGHRNFQKIGEVKTDFSESEEDRGQKRVRFSPCGNYIFCGGGDGFVRMYSFPSLRLIRQFAAHSLEKEKETSDLTVTRKILATTTRKRCLIYDIQTGTLIHTITPQNAKLSFRDTRFCPLLQDSSEFDSFDSQGDYQDMDAIESSSDAQFEPIGTEDDDFDDTEIDSISRRSAASRSVLDDPSSPSKASKSHLSRIEGREARPSSEAVLAQPDSAFLYTTEFLPKQNGIIRKWDTRTWSCVQSKTIRFNSDHLTAFGISSDGTTCAIGTVEGQVRVLDASNLREVKKWPTKHEFFVTDFAFETFNLEPLSLAQMHPTGAISLEDSIHQRQILQNADLDVLGGTQGALLTSQARASSSASNLVSSKIDAKHAKRERSDRILFSASGDNTLRATLAPNLSPASKNRGLLGTLWILFVWTLLIATLVASVVLVAQIEYPETVLACWKWIGNQIHNSSGYDATSEIQMMSTEVQNAAHFIKQLLDRFLY
jgi:WD40 repeat protein